MAKITFFSTIIILFFFLFVGSNAQNPTQLRGLTQDNPLKIALTSNPFSSIFVEINPNEASPEKRYSGFSVDVFKEALDELLKSNYKLFYNFSEFSGTYDDLVKFVGNKTFDAAVGDITMTAKRLEHVVFTVPYTQSSLALVRPVKNDQTWILFKPFSWELWLATLAIFCYTLLSVWFLERRSNPEFGVSWYHQLGNALWFTFCSLFFAQRETIKSNHARVVVVVWLFVVFIVMQSFTANLSSMLTVNSLNRNADLRKTEDDKVGCNPFMKTFVENELGYKYENIKQMRLKDEYLTAFKKDDIKVALLEIPYAKLLASKQCKSLTITRTKYNFGGLSFVFSKDYSKIANDVSIAILNLSKAGELKIIEDYLTECSSSQDKQDPDSLSLQSFSTLYLIAATIMTFAILVFIARSLLNYQRCETDDTYPGEDTV